MDNKDDSYNHITGRQDLCERIELREEHLLKRAMEFVGSCNTGHDTPIIVLSDANILKVINEHYFELVEPLKVHLRRSNCKGNIDRHKLISLYQCLFMIYLPIRVNAYYEEEEVEVVTGICANSGYGVKPFDTSLPSADLTLTLTATLNNFFSTKFGVDTLVRWRDGEIITKTQHESITQNYATFFPESLTLLSNITFSIHKNSKNFVSVKDMDGGKQILSNRIIELTLMLSNTWYLYEKLTACQ